MHCSIDQTYPKDLEESKVAKRFLSKATERISSLDPTSKLCHSLLRLIRQRRSF